MTEHDPRSGAAAALGSCPEENQLAALLAADPGGPAARDAWAHVESCEQCRELLDLLAPGRALDSDPTEPDPTEPRTRPLLSSGTRLGRYVLLEPLGSGAMGQVYAAYDPKLDRRIALKLLHPVREPLGEVRPQRLLREAQALARLSHPNVVAVFDVGEHNNDVFMAVELVSGTTLADWLRRERPSWRAALAVLVQAGRGLAAAHAAGLVHRDFKPTNVLIGDDGRVRVADFGLARLVQATPASPDEPAMGDESRLTASTALTRTGRIMGTPAYMAPEQFAGQRADDRADQFSFCVTAYEVLYDRRPFPAQSVRELATAVRTGQVLPPPRNSGVPRRVLSALRRGLSTDPAERYATMDALLSDLVGAPLRRPLIALGSGAVAVLCVLVLTGRLPGTREATAPCEDGARKLRGVWDAAQQLRMKSAFERTGVPFGVDAFRGAASRLSDYGASWVAMHREACRATRVHGEQSEALLDLRMACLERRRQQLAALTEILAQADETAVRLAVSATQALAPVAVCADAAGLLAQRRPADAQKRAATEHLRPALAQAQAQLDTGHFERGRTVATALVAKARSLGDRALEAEASYHLGRLEERLGQRRDASRSFHDAALAAEASSEDRLLAYVAAALITLEYKLEHYDEAEAWNRRAMSILERLGGDPLIDASRRYGLGWVRYARNDLDGAEREFREALTLRERHLPPDDLRIARAHDSLTMVAQRRGRHADALRHYELHLSISERALGRLHPDLSTSLYALGTALFNLGRDEEAGQRFRRAQALLRASVPQDHPVLADVTAAVGMVLAAQGRYQDALASYREAMAPAERTGTRDLRLVGKLNLLCESLLALGRASEALTSARRSLEIAEQKLGPDHVDVSRSLYVLGRASSDLGRHKDALGQLRRAAELIEKRLGPAHSDLAEVLAALATAEQRAGMPTAAADHRARALQIGKGSGLRPDRLAAIQAAAAASR